MIAQHARGPLAELSAALRFDAVPDRDDDVKIVELHFPAHLPVTFVLNHRGYLGSCLPDQLPFFVQIADMQTYGIGILFKQLRHLTLVQPDCLMVKLDLKAGFSVIRLIDENVILRTRLHCYPPEFETVLWKFRITVGNAESSQQYAYFAHCLLSIKLLHILHELPMLPTLVLLLSIRSTISRRSLAGA